MIVGAKSGILPPGRLTVGHWALWQSGQSCAVRRALLGPAPTPRALCGLLLCFRRLWLSLLLSFHCPQPLHSAPRPPTGRGYEVGEGYVDREDSGDRGGHGDGGSHEGGDGHGDRSKGPPLAHTTQRCGSRGAAGAALFQHGLTHLASGSETLKWVQNFLSLACLSGANVMVAASCSDTPLGPSPFSSQSFPGSQGFYSANVFILSAGQGEAGFLRSIHPFINV